MTVLFTLVLPDGRRFRCQLDWPGDVESLEYMLEDGNYSCDCNRSLFIQQQHDPDFPEMPCGEKIVMTDVVYAVGGLPRSRPGPPAGPTGG